jgi:hypothetical protein
MVPKLLLIRTVQHTDRRPSPDPAKRLSIRYLYRLPRRKTRLQKIRRFVLRTLNRPRGQRAGPSRTHPALRRDPKRVLRKRLRIEPHLSVLGGPWDSQ